MIQMKILIAWNIFIVRIYSVSILNEPIATDLKAVTPGTESKTHFVIVDAVGVCESDKTDSRPLERKRSTPFETLVGLVALGVRDVDTLTSLAGRLARVDRELDQDEKKEIEAAAGGKSLKQIVNGLFDAVDPDKQVETAKQLFKTETQQLSKLRKLQLNWQRQLALYLTHPSSEAHS
jgi:type I restriction enzyme R subunit